MKKKIGIAALLIAVCSLWLGFASAGEKIYSWVTDSEGNEYQCWQEGAWLYYYESEDGSTLLQYSGSETTVTLPAAFDGKPVIKILHQATNNIVNAIIPGEMAVLPEGSFSSNTNLRSVTFQNGVTEIGKNAFYGCYALEDVSFPDTLTSIGYQAFIECTSLMDVILSPTASCTIGENAFYGCTGLADLTLNPNVTAIGQAAFYECVGLNTVSLPDTLTSIGSGAFTHLEGALAELEIPASVTTLDLPIVDNECIMVVEDPSPALGILLAHENYANFRIEGESDTPEVTDGTTVAERVSAIVATVVKGGMSDYEKALVLHDYLTQHAQYNVGYENESTDPYHATNHEADGVLLKGTGVCESYTKAYGLLLDAVGIENDAQISDTHTWNLVKLDGEWYHVDVTWDDPTTDSQGTTLEISSRSGREGHHYFCVPDYALEGVSEHEFNGAGKPAATAYALNYDYLHGGLDSRLSGLESAIEVRLQAGETVFSLTSSDLAAFNPATANGILDRTALTVMQDRKYAGPEGTAYTVDTFTYNGTTLSLTMKAVEEAPANACGPNLTWSFENGTLTISGTGEMYEYADAQTPWYLAGLCNQITELNLEEGVTRLTTFAFEFCAMSEVSIPNSVLTIDRDCFLECPNLTSVSIPASTASIDPGAFYASLKFREITVNSENLYYTVKDGMLMNKAVTEIILIPNALETVVIPENITRLPEGGFYLGRHTNLTIHDGIENLNDYAFMGTVIQNLTLASGFETIQTNTFYGAKIENLFLPSTLTAVQADAFKVDAFSDTSLSYIWYDGSRASFDAITVAEEGNAAFLNAEKHYLVITAEITEVPELIDLDDEGAVYTFSYVLEGGAAPYALQYEVESFDSEENSLGLEEFTEDNLPATGALTLAGINDNAASARVRIVSVHGASGESEEPAESGTIPVKKTQVLPDPVTVAFPEGEELVLGQEIEVSWALLEGYSYESGSISFHEIREDEIGNYWDRRQTFDLTGTGGTFRYTPAAATRLTVAIALRNQDWGNYGVFQKINSYNLTGTPSVSLVRADSSLTLDKENCTMNFAYQISGGTGSYQKLHYQIIAEPEGCVDGFYPEWEILSPDASGTLTLETLLPGSYLLYMDVDDGSNWNYHVNKNYTISEADGSRDIKVHIPDTLYTKNAPQAVIWSLTGGYTPFYCNVELNFLDENGNALTEEPFVYEEGQTSGEALISLTEPMTLKAVFSIATQNPTGPRGDLILLDPMEIPITVEKASPRLNMIYSVNGEVLQPGDSFAFDQTLTVDWELSNVPEGWELGNDTQMGYRNNQAPGWTHSGDWLDEHTVLTGGAGSGCFTITPKTADSLLVMIHLYDPAAESYETLCMDEFTLTGCTLEPLNAVVTCDTDSIQRPGRRNDGTEIPRTVKVHYQITGGSGNYSMSLPDGAETSGINWYWLTEDGTDESLPYGTLDGPEGDLILSAPENAAGPLWLCIDVEDEEAGLFLLGDNLLKLQITDYVPILSEITRIPDQIVLDPDSDDCTFSYAIAGGTAPYSIRYEVRSYGTDEAPLIFHSMEAEDLPASGTLPILGVDEAAIFVKVFIADIVDAEGQGIEPAESGAIPVKPSEIVTIDVAGLTQFTLPSGITEIEEWAFSNISAEYILCPASLTAIGENAFAGCEHLICVSLPDNIDASGIGSGAFPEGVIFLCEEGSPAWQWAESNHLKRMRRKAK